LQRSPPSFLADNRKENEPASPQTHKKKEPAGQPNKGKQRAITSRKKRTLKHLIAQKEKSYFKSWIRKRRGDRRNERKRGKTQGSIARFKNTSHAYPRKKSCSTIKKKGARWRRKRGFCPAKDDSTALNDLGERSGSGKGESGKRGRRGSEGRDLATTGGSGPIPDGPSLHLQGKTAALFQEKKSPGRDKGNG